MVKPDMTLLMSGFADNQGEDDVLKNLYLVRSVVSVERKC